MIRLPELEQYTAAFGALAFEPLTVTAVMVKNARVVNYDPIHLDSVLSRAVVDMAFGHNRGLPNSNEGYWLPVPLKAAWFSEDGRPLWYSSVFLPDAEIVEDVTYRHKRTLDGWWSSGRQNRPSQGRWKDRRIPVPNAVCDRWQARIIGNAEWIERLLGGIKFMGKNRSIGFGQVDRWEIESADWTGHDIFIDDDALIRNTPSAASESTGVPWLQNPTLVAWTPPYWKRSLCVMGWRAGTVVDPLLQIDYFEAA